MGTIWMTELLRKIASKFGMSVQISNANGDAHNGADILIANHSQLPLEALRNYVGSHLIRDPRDAVISGYFYHLWTNESWAHQPDPQYGNVSYQQFLKMQNQEDGITAEIQRFSTYIRHYRLMEWDYNNPRILEIKYESLIADEPKVFTELFQHYGFSDDAVAQSLKLAESVSFKNIAKRNQGETKTGVHLRSGKPNQWVELLNSDHRDMIKSEWGELLWKMGYETNHDW